MTESSLSNLMWLQALQICAVVGVVWFATWLLKKRSPHIVHVLWLVVLLKCVTPPLWSSSTGIFCWVQTIDSAQTTTTDVAPIPPAMELSSEPVAFEPFVEFTDPSVAPQLQPSYIPIDATLPPSVAVPKTSGSSWLMGIWAGGFALATAVLGGQVIRCLMLCRHSVDNPELQHSVDLLSQQIGLRRRVPVLVTSSNVGPAVVGILRPLIILPEAIIKSVSVESLHPVLMHELIHIR